MIDLTNDDVRGLKDQLTNLVALIDEQANCQSALEFAQKKLDEATAKVEATKSDVGGQFLLTARATVGMTPVKVILP